MLLTCSKHLSGCVQMCFTLCRNVREHQRRHWNLDEIKLGKCELGIGNVIVIRQSETLEYVPLGICGVCVIDGF